jgi:hypothetical protein
MRELKFNEVDAVIGGALGADLSSVDLAVAPTAVAAETVWTRVLRDLGLPGHESTRS